MVTRFTHRSVLSRCWSAVLLLIGTALIGFSQPAFGHRLDLASGSREPDPGSTARFFAQVAMGPRCGMVQFERIPSESERESLAQLGVRLHTYIPDRTFLATIPPGVSFADLSANGATWVGRLDPEEKLSEILRTSGVTPEWSRDASGLARFSIKVYPHIPPDEAAGWLATEYGAVVFGQSRLINAVDVGLPAENWFDIAADERVLWIEPFWPRKEHNNSNRANCGADVAQAAPYSLTGAGVMVGEWDGGRADPTHTDFGGRVLAGDASSIATHATHVAGTVLGSGAVSGGTYKGMAPGAAILSQLWWLSASEMETEYADAIQNVEMDLTTNSWGLGVNPATVSSCNGLLGNYYLECGALDAAVAGGLGKPVTVVWSAGNERSTSSGYCGSVGFTWGTVSPYATAKNVIAVGAINSNNSTMTSFSSWGPTDDGRIKPEIVGPGCQTNQDFGVTSTRPGNLYLALCGTSMSAPTVSGCIALWLERYKALHPFAPPLASTVRAMFVQGADDLGDPGPEYDFGYGRLNVVKAVDLLNGGTFLEDQINHNQSLSWTFENTGSLSQITFTLAWDDPPAAENAAVTLINDLDLRLVAPSSSVYRPWVLDPANPSLSATTGIDQRNNLEQIRRTTALEVGTWTVEVTGSNIPQGPQKFSLVHNAGITLTSTSVAYAVRLDAGLDRPAMAAALPLPILVSNQGIQNDTYTVTLSSARGWTIPDSPQVIAVNAGADSTLSFTVQIPGGTPLETVDTITGVAVSQTDGGVTDQDSLTVTIVSGRAVDVSIAPDTAGVPGRTIQFDLTVWNAGLVDDTIDWTVADEAGWLIAPTSGAAALTVDEFAPISLSVTIDDPETIGLVNQIKVSAVSRSDASANDADTAQIFVFDFPPEPVAVAPVNGLLTNDATPLLTWTLAPYSPPPPGFDVFSYSVEIGDDSAVTTGVVRFNAINDTVFAPATALNDGVHFWRAIAMNAVGDSSGFGTSARFETDTQAPDAPTLLAPADGLIEADTTPLFTWNPVAGWKSGASAGVVYRWELSTDPSFATLRDSMETISSQHQIDGNAALASCSTVVFWRVSAADAAGNRSAPSTAFRYETYRPGDMIFDCIYDVLDLVALVGYTFRGDESPVPPGRAETNCTPPVDAVDVVALVNHVFRGGPVPCGPD